MISAMSSPPNSYISGYPLAPNCEARSWLNDFPCRWEETLERLLKSHEDRRPIVQWLKGGIRVLQRFYRPPLPILRRIDVQFLNAEQTAAGQSLYREL